MALALNLVQIWTWFVVPLLAIAATTVGLIYPYVCEVGSEDVPDISKVMRCVAVFVGIYTAITVSSRMCVCVKSCRISSLIDVYFQKIEFSSFVELIITMGALAVGMWWLFDRSRGGLLLSLIFTTISTLTSHALIYFTDLKYVVLQNYTYFLYLPILSNYMQGIIFPHTHMHRIIDAGFWYSRLWCLYFSGCITFGAIGRRLAAAD